MITTSSLPPMTCINCKKDFHPYGNLFLAPKKGEVAPDTWWFCQNCIETLSEKERDEFFL